jgi:hypothetical protein
MIGRDDWDDAYREIIVDGRSRLGDPPAPETLERYARGELPQGEMERIREALIYYPDLAIALMEARPPEATDLEPELTEEEIAVAWESVRRRVERPAATPKPSVIRAAPVRGWAVAATLAAVGFAGLYFQSLHTVRGLRRQLSIPQTNDGTRGGAASTPIRLQPATENVLLVLTLVDERDFEDYGVDLVDDLSTKDKVIWSKTDLHRRTDGTFALKVSRSLLANDSRRLLLYGGHDRSHPVAAYTLPRILE